jgi:Lanthionine synthetase C-like protein
VTGDHLGTALAVADAVAVALATPADACRLHLPQGWWPQSLAHGAAGVALLHIERARTGHGPWQPAREWLACAADGEVAAGTGSHLYYGAPAVAFALHAAADQTGHYHRALDSLDRHIAAATRTRLDHAHRRIDDGELPALAEFDTVRGLAGIGAYLLRRDPDGDLIRAILAYLVRLTEPVTHDGDVLPGWWTSLDPAGKPSTRYPRGHGNVGMARSPCWLWRCCARSWWTGTSGPSPGSVPGSTSGAWTRPPVPPGRTGSPARGSMTHRPTGSVRRGRRGATARRDSPAPNSSPPWPPATWIEHGWLNRPSPAR